MKKMLELLAFQYRWIGGGLMLKLYLLLNGAAFVVSAAWEACELSLLDMREAARRPADLENMVTFGLENVLQRLSNKILEIFYWCTHIVE